MPETLHVWQQLKRPQQARRPIHCRACAIAEGEKMWDAQRKRKPRLLLRLFGLLLLRLAARALFRLLFQDPPRTARTYFPGDPAS